MKDKKEIKMTKRLKFTSRNTLFLVYSIMLLQSTLTAPSFNTNSLKNIPMGLQIRSLVASKNNIIFVSHNAMNSEGNIHYYNLDSST